jgi:hypothetical protein
VDGIEIQDNGGAGGYTSWLVNPEAACTSKKNLRMELEIAAAGAVAEELDGSGTNREPLVSCLMSQPKHDDWNHCTSDARVAKGLSALLSQSEGTNQVETIRDAEDHVRK